ncbi:MAG: tetratricopeptide repeat protein [Acidobacteria bacterium]|nr:tetratricopeptide repeat protein [Acidobacteriota bacterium]
MIGLLVAFQLFDPAVVGRLHEERIARQPDSRMAKRDLGLYWLRNGRPVEAERWLRAAGAEPLFLAEAVAAQGRHEEAESLFGACVELARCLTRLAHYAERRGDMARALEHYKAALSEEPGPARRNDYAQALQALRRVKEAEQEYRTALAESEKKFGPHHPETATTLNNLAMLLAETERVWAAVPLQRRALSIFQKSLGPNHERTRTAGENLKEMLP